jgi:hypothetical protein
MNYVIENMNKLNMSVDQAAGYLATFNTRKVENPSLNSSDYQDNKLPGIYHIKITRGILKLSAHFLRCIILKYNEFQVLMVKKMNRGKTKILRIQAILFALFILLTISLPKSAIANPAYIYVYPTNQGPSGIWVRVNGWGFHNYTLVTIYFDDKIVGSVNTYARGYFYIWFQIPETNAGIHTIIAKDAEGLTASTTFTVTKPRMTLPSTSGPAGVNVTISSTELGSYQMYTLKTVKIPESTTEKFCQVL